MIDARRRATPGETSGKVVRYRDPAGRFELHYPSDWLIHAEASVQVTSPERGIFARVDVLPRTPWLWRDIESAFVLAGIRLEIEESDDDHAHGAIQVGSVRLAWQAHAYPVPGGVLVLSLGNIPAAGDLRILDTIHRDFRVSA